MAKRRKKPIGTAIGTSVGGGWVGSKPGSAGLPGGVPAGTVGGPQNPYTATAPPIDPSYEAYKVSAGRNTALADADAAYQGQRIENEYGLGADTSNPWSKAKLLEENYKRSQRGTQNSAGNQLYSGSYQRAQSENTRNYSMGYDQLARGYQDAKYNVTRGQLGSYAENAMGVDDEKFRALLRAITGGA